MCKGIAIVGMACEYPDASNPKELWENVISRRRSFRKIPKERLNLKDYFSTDRSQIDKTYSNKAALIKNYSFDRVKFKISGPTYKNTDLTHWLALDVSERAIRDAGFNDLNIPKDRTGVLIGNSLTGEFSRANIMGFRWPYVQRVVESILEKENAFEDRLDEVLGYIKKEYLKAFPTINEDTLAGGLSNTIAGRICNYFDLKGGGYTVDGACSSSLLAITKACSALENNELDLAIAGGVDLSIDPFEVLGFARNGALAKDNMLIYDKDSNGFWPGEGCGIVVLMRVEDAINGGFNPYAVIKGWGISSDGKGGITRPEVDGQVLALSRAYEKAGYDLDSVPYIEGHGTGTKYGDETELRTVSTLKKNNKHLSYIGSVKGNIGHTKAASGVAGLIKTVMALSHQVIPPATGCENPNPEFLNEKSKLQTTSVPILWPQNQPLRAGVSAMGFGGINTHITLENQTGLRRKEMDYQNVGLTFDHEIFVFGNSDINGLIDEISSLMNEIEYMSLGEFADFSSHLLRNNRNRDYLLTIVAKDPEDLYEKLKLAIEKIKQKDIFLSPEKEIYFGSKLMLNQKMAFLYPGQGSPIAKNLGVIGDLDSSLIFEELQEDFLPKARENTHLAQPLITAMGIEGTRFLNNLGIDGDFGLGHSLGELTALAWGQSISTDTLYQLSKERGKLMESTPQGIMFSTNAPLEVIDIAIKNEQLDIAAVNHSEQIILSGDKDSGKRVLKKLESKGYSNTVLKVTRAFHSSLMKGIREKFEYILKRTEIKQPKKKVVSTVSGEVIREPAEIRSLLKKQLTDPVMFQDAVNLIENQVDLFVEIGAGSTLTSIVNRITKKPVLSLNIGTTSVRNILNIMAASIAIGKEINLSTLLNRRKVKAYEKATSFFVNPCETVQEASLVIADNNRVEETVETSTLIINKDRETSIDILIQIISEKTELPINAIKEDARMLDDLHLNSISVSQIIVETAKSIGKVAPVSPTDFANSTVKEISTYFDDDSNNHKESNLDHYPGVDSWIQSFQVKWKAEPSVDQVIKKGKGKWISVTNNELAIKLSKQLNKNNIGRGILAYLEDPNDKTMVWNLIKELQKSKEQQRLVIIQNGDGLKSFGKSFYLENPNSTVCIIDAKLTEKNLPLILKEIQSSDGFVEVKYTSKNERRVPYLKVKPVTRKEKNPTLNKGDVLLVTGGAKGITAECVRHLAKEKGVKLAILGRSKVTNDSEIAKNLSLLVQQDIEFKYISADITNPDSVAEAVIDIEKNLGTIRGVVHAAGINKPKAISDLNYEDLEITIDTKVLGLKNVLSSIPNKDNLKLLITFGSIIGQSGMQGDAHYAIANELLRKETDMFSKEFPHVKALCIEWSIWEGLGMGNRIGTLDQLKRKGIQPLTIDQGTKYFMHLVNHEVNSSSVVSASRLGGLPTISLGRSEDIQFGRFLEDPLIEIDGVELITQAILDPETDKYLNDHILEHQKIFPGVMALEAMSQIANALLGKKGMVPTFKNVRFNHPIIVNDIGTKIRICGLVDGINRVKVAIRSEDTNYSVNHVEGICQFVRNVQLTEEKSLDKVILLKDYRPRPSEDLYKHVLFQKGVFKNIEEINYLSSKKNMSLIKNVKREKWFGGFLPNNLITKNIGTRDSIIHSLQASYPYQHLIPLSVKEIRIKPGMELHKHIKVVGNEIEKKGDILTFNIQVSSLDGTIIETWDSLKLKVVGNEIGIKTWNPFLLGPYLERKLDEMIPKGNIQVFLDSNSLKKQQSMFAKQMVSNAKEVRKRLDGKPIVSDDLSLSVSTMDHLVLAVSNTKNIGCDVEKVQKLPNEIWEDMLGKKHLQLASYLSKTLNEDLNTTATRAWTIFESIKKLGLPDHQPIVFKRVSGNMVELESGSVTIATTLVDIRTVNEPVVITIAAEV